MCICWGECPFCGTKYSLEYLVIEASSDVDVVVSADLIIECSCGATFVGEVDEGD